MKEWMKKLALLVTAVMLLAALTGCGRPKIEADKAVDAWLRSELKGDFEDYAAFLGDEVEEVEEDYNDNIDELKEVFEEAGLIDAKDEEEFRSVIKQVLSTSRYEVGNVAEDEAGNYTVDVNVCASDIFNLYFEKVIKESLTATEDTDMSTVTIQALKDAVAAQAFDEGKVYQIHLDYDKEDKKYYFDDDETEALTDGLFVPYDEEAIINKVLAESRTVYDDPYFNWIAEDWLSASVEEQTICCLKIIQELEGLTDEEMAEADLENPDTQAAMQMMIDNITMSYEYGMYLNIGDFVELVKEESGIE